jgi:hypothetical protein
MLAHGTCSGLTAAAWLACRPIEPRKLADFSRFCALVSTPGRLRWDALTPAFTRRFDRHRYDSAAIDRFRRSDICWRPVASVILLGFPVVFVVSMTFGAWIARNCALSGDC